MDFAVRGGLRLKALARREARAVALGEPLQLAGDARGAQVVGVAQRASAERREPEAEDGADVAVAWGAGDALAPSPRGLGEDYEGEPPDDLRRPRGDGRGAGR